MTQQFNSVFISYASEDFITASKLYDFLIENDYNPWLDKHELLPGQSWDIEIRQALRRADFIILLLSKISVEKRGYVQREFKLALEYIEEKLDTDIYMIPCKIDNCETPYKLNKYQWVYLNDNESFNKIIASLNMQRKLYKDAEQRKILSHFSFDYETIEKVYSIDSQPKSSIEVEYPRFKNTENETLNELNSIIEGSVIRQFVGGRTIIISSKEDEGLLDRYTEFGTPGYSISITYEFTLISKDFVSLIANSYYFTGGAHGNYNTLGYNYILNSLDEVDKFSILTNSSIIEYVSNTCRSYIIDKVKANIGKLETDSDYFLSEDPLLPDIENFRNFFLDKEGLNIIFNPYEVTAYVHGQHIIPIPYSQLLLLDPSSDLLKKLVETKVLV